jgi:hypothetical protein
LQSRIITQEVALVCWFDVVILHSSNEVGGPLGLDASYQLAY